jgi:hypothetical protein
MRPEGVLAGLTIPHGRPGTSFTATHLIVYVGSTTMSYDVAHETCVCRIQHKRPRGSLQPPALWQISYPAALLVAVLLGFVSALVALSASEAVATKEGSAAALRVEMAKPPQCSIETPDRLFFL